MTIKPILVTGSPRSGTTWVGNILALSQNLLYIQEPFNPNIKYSQGRCGVSFDYWFQYICSDNEEKYLNSLKNTFSLNYDINKALRDIKNLRSFKIYAGEYRRFIVSKLKNRQPLIKDPISIFSAEWIASNFDPNIIILIRNPVAFVGSMKKANWLFDFNNFLQQPLLIDKYLSGHADEIKLFATHQTNIIEGSILLWKCIYNTVHQYRQNHPDWIFLKHEDLSLNVIDSFCDLFNQLNLDMTDEIRKNINSYSEASSKPDHLIQTLEIKRNSADNLQTYKNRLTEEEINLIKIKTEEVAGYFYSSKDY